MKFYECIDKDGCVFDCVLTLKEAKQIVGAAGGGRIHMLDMNVSKETIMRLVGNHGGYANEVIIHEVKP